MNRLITLLSYLAIALISNAQNPTMETLQINPTGGSSPANLIVFGSELLFTANDGTNGVQLWAYDGNEATQLIVNTSGDANPENLVVFGSELFFAANDGVNGNELWKYDGTTVSLVANINSSGDSNPSQFFEFNNRLYFVADDGIHSGELWEYNSGNLRLITDTEDIANDMGVPIGFTEFNGSFYFGAQGPNGMDIYEFDPDLDTVVYYNTSGFVTTGNRDPEPFIVYNNELYVIGNGLKSGFNTGIELFKFENNQVVLVEDIYSGDRSSAIEELTVANGLLYFVATSETYSSKLYSYDGQVLELIDSTGASSYYGPSRLTEFQDQLYFRAGGSSGSDLYTEINSKLERATDINPTESTFPTGLVEIDSELYFSATDGSSGLELWKFDGISAELVYDINPNGDSSPSEWVQFDGDIFVIADNGSGSGELIRLIYPKEVSGIETTEQQRMIIGAYSILGGEVDIMTKGQIIILKYSDGSAEKVFRY